MNRQTIRTLVTAITLYNLEEDHTHQMDELSITVTDSEWTFILSLFDTVDKVAVDYNKGTASQTERILAIDKA